MIRKIASATRPPSDQLTVLIFKDNYAARTFKIPLRWISQFGLALGALVLTGFVSVGLAVHAYRRPAGPGVGNLTASPPGAAPAAAPDERIAQLESQLRALKASEPAPLPVLSPAEQSPNAPLVTGPQLFTALPAQVSAPPASPSITVQSLKARWSGDVLRVTFNIEYSKTDQGSQQGRIILLARGDGMLLSYPRHALHLAGQESLIDIEQGEHFSVSRLRPVRADFGPVASPDSIDEVEIIVVSQSGQLLIHQKIEPEESE